jgi:hypothetical protein
VVSHRALARGYFKPAAVRAMVSAQMAGSNENQYALWDMLLLERWHTMFIDKPIGVRSRADRATLNARG